MLHCSCSSDLVQAGCFNRVLACLPGCVSLVATDCRRLDIIMIVRCLLLRLAQVGGEGVAGGLVGRNCD